MDSRLRGNDENEKKRTSYEAIKHHCISGEEAFTG
jgi:hypothetical protein